MDGLLAHGLVVAAAALLSGCHLLTPFEPVSPPDGDADGDTDQPIDGDVARDGEVEADAEVTVDGGDGGEDSGIWDESRGCGGEVSGEERWLVGARVGDQVRSYLTGRDCLTPELLCEDCYVTAISPSGDRAVGETLDPHGWSPHRELFIVDLLDPAFPTEHLGTQGTHVSWLDDSRFTYVTPSACCPESCVTSGGPPERTDVHLFDLDERTSTIFVEATHRAWQSCCPLVAPSEERFVFVGDFHDECEEHNVAVVLRDRHAEHDVPLGWTLGGDQEYLFGLLPDRSGFLLQQADGSYGLSSIYVMLWDGRATSIYSDLPLAANTRGPLLMSRQDIWGRCATVRRLGPACEFYCRQDTPPPDETSTWVRVTAAGDAPVSFECPVEGENVRIMDVWQG